MSATPQLATGADAARAAAAVVSLRRRGASVLRCVSVVPGAAAVAAHQPRVLLPVPSVDGTVAVHQDQRRGRAAVTDLAHGLGLDLLQALHRLTDEAAVEA